MLCNVGHKLTFLSNEKGEGAMTYVGPRSEHLICLVKRPEERILEGHRIIARHTFFPTKYPFPSSFAFKTFSRKPQCIGNVSLWKASVLDFCRLRTIRNKQVKKKERKFFPLRPCPSRSHSVVLPPPSPPPQFSLHSYPSVAPPLLPLTPTPTLTLTLTLPLLTSPISAVFAPSLTSYGSSSAPIGNDRITARRLTLSLQRVINFKFLLQPHQKYDIKQYGRVAAIGSLFSDRFPMCSSPIVFSVKVIVWFV